MDVLKLSPVFIKWSVLYMNIPVEKHHIICISRLWTIVTRQSRYNLLISVLDNFGVEQYTIIFDIHVVPTIVYPNCVVFD